MSQKTPAQQRQYLNELRKQNEELYHLTGHPKRDPRMQTSITNNHTSFAVSQSRPARNVEGPPKPPKTLNLQSSSPKVDHVRASDQAENSTIKVRSAGLSDERGIVERKADPPKILPKPPQTKNSAPRTGSGVAEVSPVASTKTLPDIPPKSRVLSESSSSQQKENETPQGGRKVTLKLTNFDLQYDSESANFDSQTRDLTALQDKQTQPDNSSGPNKVTIPIFTFSDPSDDRTSSQKAREPAQSAKNIDVPSISLSEATQSTQQVHNVNGIPGEQARRRKRRLPIPGHQREAVRRGLSCANCYESLGSGRVITTDSRRYHPSHFTCFECGVPLEHVEFYIHRAEEDLSLDSISLEDRSSQSKVVEDEEVYCHYDYHELFSPRCHTCTTPVIRDGIRALGNVYHAEHFFCALCSQTFIVSKDGAPKFVEKDGHPWHPKCYEEKFSKSYMCRKCSRRIEAGETVIKMGLGSHFHSRCFLCAKCKSSLEDGFYWSKAKEGICKPCKELEVKEVW